MFYVGEPYLPQVKSSERKSEGFESSFEKKEEEALTRGLTINFLNVEIRGKIFAFSTDRETSDRFGDSNYEKLDIVVSYFGEILDICWAMSGFASVSRVYMLSFDRVRHN